jgi:DNA-directed RNA polymerase specialized sigma24 family protein
MKTRKGGRYRETEVRALIEQYAVTLEDRDTTERGLRALLAIADLKLAYRRLALTDKEVLLVCGVLGLPLREAAEWYEKSHTWVGKQYRVALENLTYEMNGGLHG